MLARSSASDGASTAAALHQTSNMFWCQLSLSMYSHKPVLPVDCDQISNRSLSHLKCMKKHKFLHEWSNSLVIPTSTGPRTCILSMLGENVVTPMWKHLACDADLMQCILQLSFNFAASLASQVLQTELWLESITYVAWFVERWFARVQSRAVELK